MIYLAITSTGYTIYDSREAVARNTELSISSLSKHDWSKPYAYKGILLIQMDIVK